MTPQETTLAWEEIEDVAANVAEQYGYDPRRTSVRALAQQIAGTDCIQILPIDEIEHLDSGSLEVFGAGNFKIYLSPITSKVRDNFTIAHELGHYFLHSGDPVGSKRIRAGRSGESTVVEQEANRFAAALLMPKNIFVEAFSASDGDILTLTGLFSVSRPAVAVRIKSLRLV